MNMNMMMLSSKNKYPFTPSQWQELEHQALVFKYMVSGIPIPPDLLFTIRTSLHSKLFLHQHPQHLFQMGFGRKIDPEPGRCRRTDGKKWRCSKEAYPDSKYCERHMHRGRNRSRKPVEIMSSSSSTPPTTTTAANTCITHDSHFVYPHFSSSRPPSIGLSSQESTTNNFFLDSTTHSSDKDFRNRYVSGLKGESDEQTFFSVNDSSWKLGSSDLSSQTKQKLLYTSCDSQSDQQSYHNMTTNCDEHQPKKVMHHFLDEWSPKHNESDNQDRFMSTHRTQLSISTPTSMHDFFITRKW